MKTRYYETPYDVIADRYDEMFGDENIYYATISAKERQVFEMCVPLVHRNRDALDIGCGTGFHSQWLADRGYRTVGIDVSREMLRVARAKSHNWSNSAEFLLCDALDMSVLGSRSFDVITCLGSTLNHIQDWRLFSSEVSKLLRPNGKFIFSCDNFMGIDTILWLFKKRQSGYAEDERVHNFKKNIRCLLTGQPFRNHWRMEAGKTRVELALTYETVGSFKHYLSEFGLEIQSLTGVHLLSCFVPDIINASANLHQNVSRTHRSWSSRVLLSCEGWLSPRFPQICANIVGVSALTSTCPA